MSVFGDFQRMWVQRFPQSSLSDAWEQDVRASLERHKQKIAVLSKELEQETLYVEYLERLLGDVEKYREAGGDPSTLFEANSPASAANLLAGGGQLRDSLPGHGDGAHEPDEEEVVSEDAPFPFRDARKHLCWVRVVHNNSSCDVMRISEKWKVVSSRVT